MADVTQYKIFKNDKYQVLTQDGFKDFKGIIKGKNPKKLRIQIYGKSLLCTPKHKISITDTDWVYAKDLNEGDKIYADITIISIEHIENDDFVYDFLHIEDTHTYYANGILSKNCLIVDEMGFIDEGIMNEFWSAVYPTISSSEKSKVLIASTPNGVGNLYHKLWERAQIPKSGWGSVKVPWNEVPGKTKEWAEQERIALGDDQFQQEYECKFLESGESFIPEDLYKEIEKECRSAKLVLDDSNYKLYEKPDPKNRTYVAGVDIGEGVGACASTICILDITELTNIEQVATYHCDDMGPYEFAKKTNEVLSHWGKPPVAVERNNTGGGVVITTLDKEYNYPRLIQFSTKQGTIDYSGLKGVTSSTNTKHHGVMNMFYFVKTHRRVILHDLDYLKELNTFVRHSNNKWSKRKGDNIFDDRVDALIWALIGIHEMVVGQFYHVTIWDDNKKPLHVQPMYEIENKSNTEYLFGTHENNYGIDSVVMPAAFTDDPELARMNDAGWLLPEQAGHWSSYEPAENYFGRNY